MKPTPFNPQPRPVKFWDGIPIFFRPGRKSVTVRESKIRRLAVKNERRAKHGLEPLTDHVQA